MRNFEEQRCNMVRNQISIEAIKNRKILDVMYIVQKEMFIVDSTFNDVAYLDRRLPVGYGRELMQPLICAKMIDLAGIEESDHILDMVCATGYTTALLSHLGKSVVGVDNVEWLVNKAAANLEKIGANNYTMRMASFDEVSGDARLFDVIMVNCLISQHNVSKLLGNLSRGGRLITVEDVDGMSKAVRYVKSGYGAIGRTEHFAVCAPRLSDMA